MADWDPLAVDETTEATFHSRAAGGVIPIAQEDTIEIEGATAHVVRRDLDKCMETVWNKLREEQPWQQMPDPKPDLSWHSPSCTFESWAHSDVRVELGDGIAYITFNRPHENNKFNDTLIAGLVDAVFLLHSRKDIRVAVFTGEGKMFCCGGPPKGDGDGGFTKTKLTQEVERSIQAMASKALKGGAFPDGQVNLGLLMMTRLWHAWATLPQFTICLANGSAMGDGLGAVVCCDYAIGIKTAYFCLADVKIGIVPAGIAPYIVMKTGTGIAKRLLCTSENMSAQSAFNDGIIDEVVESVADGHKAIQNLCKRLTECGPRTVELTKEVVFGVAGQQISEPLMFYTSKMLAIASASEEAKASLVSCKSESPTPWRTSPIKPVR